MAMRRYRYRTQVLAGPWRDSPDLALADAVRARQVRYEDAGDVRWIVPGVIEEDGKEQPAGIRPRSAH